MNAIDEAGSCSSSRLARTVAILTEDPAAGESGRVVSTARRTAAATPRQKPTGFPAVAPPWRGCANTFLTSTGTRARNVALAGSPITAVLGRGNRECPDELGLSPGPCPGTTKGSQICYTATHQTRDLLRTSPSRRPAAGRQEQPATGCLAARPARRTLPGIAARRSLCQSLWQVRATMRASAEARGGKSWSTTSQTAARSIPR